MKTWEMETDEVSENISLKEKDLAEKLKNVCTPYGDERLSKLQQCTDILHKMGCLYLDKTTTTSGMQQKLNFIKCAALLHGAKFRYDMILNDPIGSKKIEESIQLLDSRLLTTLSANKDDNQVYAVSVNVFRGFKQFRESEKTAIARFEILDENMIESEMIRLQAGRINTIQKLMKDTTENFKHLMQYIAKNCIKILGDPPCAFAIVGLGSLAREEITLYSDFEHVIVLEEGVQELSKFEYNNIREYFRWFAVLFQIIMTGLGETIIRSVGVKSINDLYVDDKKKNWYYDMFTVSGVSFDGMVPHSCNTPLGRQEYTKERQHKVELIQPASKMASYLTNEEHVKNGYYLKDILTRTCFVYGDEQVYIHFRQLVGNVLKEEINLERYEEVSKEIEKNVNIGVSGTTWLLHESVKFDIKTIFYRPLTALLAYAARLFEIPSSSSFDISSKLDFLVNKDLHKLNYALATACELRIKAYAQGGDRRYKVTSTGVYKFVSKKCAINCLQLTHDFAELVRACIMKRLGRTLAADKIEPGPGVTGGVTPALMFMNEYEDAVPRLEEELSAMSNFKNEKLEIWRIHSTIMENDRLGIRPTEEWLESTENILLDIIKNNDTENIKLTNACALLSTMYSDQERREDLARIHEIWFKHSMSQKNISGWYFDFGGSMLMIRTDQVLAMEQFMTAAEMLDKCNEELRRNDDIYSELAFRLGVAIAQVNMELCELGAQGLRDVLSDAIQRACSTVGKPMLIEFSEAILCTQVTAGLFKDAYYTLKATDVVQESQMGHVGEVSAKNGIDIMKLNCLLGFADDELDEETRTDIISRSLDVCRSSNDEYIINFRYISVLHLLLKIDLRNMELFDVDLFVQVYSEAPVEVQNNERLKFVMMKSFPSLLQYCFNNLRVGKSILDSLWRLKKIVTAFPCHFNHPHVFGLLQECVNSKSITIRQAEFMKLPNRQTVFSALRVESGSPIHLPTIKSEVKKYDARKSADFFWRNLQASFYRGDIKSHDVKNMLQIVYSAICTPIIDWLRDFATKTFYAHSMNVVNTSASIYNKGVCAFYGSAYRKAAKLFWKTINIQETNAMIRMRSVVMLNHIIIFRMVQTDIVANFYNNFISLCDIDTEEDLRSYINIS